MCFSPEGDLVGGVVVTAIGIDACLHVRGRQDHRLLAALPLLLGAHLLVETFVWWGLAGVVPASLGRVAMWVYLLIAFVVLPTLVPIVVINLEPTSARKWRIVPFLVVGVVVSAILLEAMVRVHPSVHLGAYHLSYTIGLQHGIAIIGCYIVATCGALLASQIRDIVYFGLANVVAVVILARLSADGFASLWCFYAAIASAAIVVHMRHTKSEQPRAKLAV